MPKTQILPYTADQAPLGRVQFHDAPNGSVEIDVHRRPLAGLLTHTRTFVFFFIGSSIAATLLMGVREPAMRSILLVAWWLVASLGVVLLAMIAMAFVASRSSYRIYASRDQLCVEEQVLWMVSRREWYISEMLAIDVLWEKARNEGEYDREGLHLVFRDGREFFLMGERLPEEVEQIAGRIREATGLPKARRERDE